MKYPDELFLSFSFFLAQPGLASGWGGGEIFSKLLQVSSASPSNFLFLTLTVFSLGGRLVGGAGGHFLIFTSFFDDFGGILASFLVLLMGSQYCNNFSIEKLFPDVNLVSDHFFMIFVLEYFVLSGFFPSFSIFCELLLYPPGVVGRGSGTVTLFFLF